MPLPEGYRLPVIDVDIKRCHAQPIVDFSDEKNLLDPGPDMLPYVRKNRWLSVDIGSFRFLRSLSPLALSCTTARALSRCQPEPETQRRQSNRACR